MLRTRRQLLSALVMRLPQFARVGMAGHQRPGDGWRFWALRRLDAA